MTHRSRRGFSLIEILVTATIVAVLTVIGVVSYSSVNKRSRDVKRKSDLEQIRSALEMYRTDNGAYPNAGGESMTQAGNLSAALVTGGYMPTVPSDPDPDKSYYYKVIDVGGVYTSYCVCASLETIPDVSPESSCTVNLPQACDYGLKNP